MNKLYRKGRKIKRSCYSRKHCEKCSFGQKAKNIAPGSREVNRRLTTKRPLLQIGKRNISIQYITYTFENVSRLKIIVDVRIRCNLVH